jgi:hypothetical protein
MESDKSKIASLVSEKKGGGSVNVSDPAQLGGAQTSLEQPFLCFLHANGCN